MALYQESSWQGFLPAAFFAFLLVLGVRWGLLGVMGFLRPLPPRKTSYGVALLDMIVLTGVGPSVSAAYQKSHEPEHWQKALAATRARKELGRFSFRSEPAKHVSYSTDPSDPKWAPYSIIMDSAADNFGRLIVGRLGLNPPPVRENYKFIR